jgi:Uncharacterized protein conserved in bacteria (DUF2188)
LAIAYVDEMLDRVKNILGFPGEEAHNAGYNNFRASKPHERLNHAGTIRGACHMAKAKLARYSVTYNSADGRWELKHEVTKEVVKKFKTKADAIKGGVLEKAVKEGSVRIRKRDGRIQEERTYPRSRDPRGSKG